MAEKQLYPVFEVPDFVAKKNEENRKQQYKPSVYFDYATGDFRLDGAGFCCNRAWWTARCYDT